MAALVLTEAGTKRRASLHVVRGRGGAERTMDPGGIDVLSQYDLAAFRAASDAQKTAR
jgi:formamidopyrimidine-DNA glycosylase